MKQIQALLGATANSQLARLFKALSLRPTFQPTSTPEQASRLLVKMQRRFLNKRSAIRTAMRKNSISCWPLQLMPTQNWILFKCMFDSLCGLLFVLTRSSCAPLTLFGFCFCSFQRKPGCHSIGPSLGPSYLISKMCGGICSLWPQTTQLFRVWSEKPFFSFSKRFLVAICRAQPRAGCKCIWERLVWNPLQASTVEHSWITLAYGSYPSSIGLSQDMWHCGRRCL